MTTRTTRANARWTKGATQVLAVLSAMLITLLTIMVGGVAFAPAAQACDDWGCASVSVPAKFGQADYCDPANGQDKVVTWTGEAWGPKSYGPVEFPFGTGKPKDTVTCDYASKDAALLVGNDFVDKSVAEAEAAARKAATGSGWITDKCPTPAYRCEPVTVPLDGSGQYCLATGVTDTLTWNGSGTAYYHVVTQGYPQTFPKCPMTMDEATAEAQRLAGIDLADQKAAATEGATPGMCKPDGQTYSATGSAGGSVDFCTVDGTTAVVTYSGVGSATSTVSQADANFVAQQKADASAQADLAAKTPSTATLGACGVPQVTPTPVAAVEPATVAVPEPATIVVPAAATLPATVPAGDGSSVPSVPVAALALLSLAAVGAGAAGLRLVTTR